MLLPQYKNSPPKAQTTAFKNSLLKIGGVDARSLVEIKRRRIGYTLSIFSRGMDAAGYIRSDVSAVSETHSQNYTRMYSFDDATTQIPAYFQKVVDTHSFVGIIPQQLSNFSNFSNSATQQLSNSATQQLRRKGGLCPDKWAAFTFRQHHHYFFSYIFADGKSGVSVFTFTHRRYFAVLGVFCALGMQRSRFCKHIINTAFYRRSRPAVWFDSG